VIGPPLRCGIAKIAKPTGSKHTPFLTQVDGGWPVEPNKKPIGLRKILVRSERTGLFGM
jgi:hypothetical protein